MAEKKFNEEELQQAKTIFEKYDHDKSGLISVSEMTQIMEDMGLGFLTNDETVAELVSKQCIHSYLKTTNNKLINFF